MSEPVRSPRTDVKTAVASSADVQKAMGVLSQKLNRQLAASFNACVHCGLCADACHYFLATGDPKMVPAYKADQIRKLYRRAYDWLGRIFPAWVGAEELDDKGLDRLFDVAFGSCTMCRRCTLNCPMGVDIAALIRTARSMLVTTGRVPAGLQATVDMALKTGNNMGIKKEDYLDTVAWMEEELQAELGQDGPRIPIDRVGANYLFLMNPREPMYFPLTIQAAAKIFYAAGEDWTISSEYWDATNYGLFSGDDNATKIICQRCVDWATDLQPRWLVMTECGHGYRAMRWESETWLKRKLPFGVKSFPELMAEYIQAGRVRLDPTRNRVRVTYHDPCNLARSGGVVEEPRVVLRHCVSDFVEMTPHGVENFCCGGGGGALTMSEFRERRLQSGKIKADQIRATGAKIVATTCHNCVDQIQELNRHYRLGIEVKLLCEMVADALVIPK
jgi:Fe-S oxidoreductase